ncbi:hypothetical protein [Rummeliibacillus suwonensis]|uniref:hypothetical protein n=1 Tax=Rummeliibacillus suwonensis TaxID=1306154 RepID=UPI0028A2697D|nr:hypothetical protein [Rummeliibacillus suwonensis]
MEINQNTDSIRTEIASGKTIDLQGRFPSLGLPNEAENEEKANELADILYNMGYIHYFSEIGRDSERLVRNGVTNRAFYLIVDGNCKLYISTNPNTDRYEVKYVVYDNVLNYQNLQHIIYTLYAMGMLISYEKAS